MLKRVPLIQTRLILYSALKSGSVSEIKYNFLRSFIEINSCRRFYRLKSVQIIRHKKDFKYKCPQIFTKNALFQRFYFKKTKARFLRVRPDHLRGIK
jgi:hypothetical protein